jgi:hypothetical protein
MGVPQVLQSGLRIFQSDFGKRVAAGVLVAVLGAVLIKVLVDRPPSPEPIVDWGVEGGQWIVPRSIDEVDPIDSYSSLAEWEQEHGAVAHTRQDVIFTIQGASERSIILMDIEVDVEKEAVPLEGVGISTRTGGTIDARWFDVTLSLDDATPAVAAKASDIPELEDTKPVEFPFKISQSDPEQLILYAHASDCDCTWRARIEWIDAEGQRGSTLIPPRGEPALRLTALPEGTPEYSWEDGTWIQFE